MGRLEVEGSVADLLSAQVVFAERRAGDIVVVVVKEKEILKSNGQQWTSTWCRDHSQSLRSRMMADQTKGDKIFFLNSLSAKLID